MTNDGEEYLELVVLSRQDFLALMTQQAVAVDYFEAEQAADIAFSLVQHQGQIAIPLLRLNSKFLVRPFRP